MVKQQALNMIQQHLSLPEIVEKPLTKVCQLPEERLIKALQMQ